MYRDWRALLESTKWGRTIVAFVVAPLSPALIIMILVTAFGAGKVGEAAWLLRFSALLGYPIALGLGIPIFFLLKRADWNSLSLYVALGVIAGLILYLFYFPPLELSPRGEIQFSKALTSGMLLFSVLGMICGALATTVFWLIARPDI